MEGGAQEFLMRLKESRLKDDELLEVTPKSLRIRKKILDSRLRKRSNMK